MISFSFWGKIKKSAQKLFIYYVYPFSIKRQGHHYFSRLFLILKNYGAVFFDYFGCFYSFLFTLFTIP